MSEHVPGSHFNWEGREIKKNVEKVLNQSIELRQMQRKPSMDITCDVNPVVLSQ